MENINKKKTCDALESGAFIPFIDAYDALENINKKRLVMPWKDLCAVALCCVDNDIQNQNWDLRLKVLDSKLIICTYSWDFLKANTWLRSKLLGLAEPLTSILAPPLMTY